MTPELLQFEKKVTRALELDLPYLGRPGRGGSDPVFEALKQSRPAGVLALFGRTEESGELSLLLTRRADSVETHKGQIAFPGGVVDETDEAAGGIITTALRETEEEIGLSRDGILVVGQLPELFTFTGFRVTPVIGLLRDPIERVEFRSNPGEIAETFWVSLKLLTDPATYKLEYFPAGEIRYPIHVYYVHGHRVWGATAAIVKNMLDRMAALE